jgi:hypothetical protein
VPPAVGTYLGYQAYRLLERLVGGRGRKPVRVEPTAEAEQAPRYSEL